MKRFLPIIVILLVVGASFLIAYGINNGGDILGSVTVGNEYESGRFTSTNATGTAMVFGKSGNTTIGSVVITVPATAGYFALHNATSTAVATSTAFTELIAKFDSASDVVGTYTFDTNVANGLMFEVSDNFNGEYTVTWR